MSLKYEPSSEPLHISAKPESSTLKGANHGRVVHGEPGVDPRVEVCRRRHHLHRAGYCSRVATRLVKGDIGAIIHPSLTSLTQLGWVVTRPVLFGLFERAASTIRLRTLDLSTEVENPLFINGGIWRDHLHQAGYDPRYFSHLPAIRAFDDVSI